MAHVRPHDSHMRKVKTLFGADRNLGHFFSKNPPPSHSFKIAFISVNQLIISFTKKCVLRHNADGFLF